MDADDYYAQPGTDAIDIAWVIEAARIWNDHLKTNPRGALMGLFSKNETGKPCQACGHETTPQDPAVRTEDGARIHKSHTTTPGNGFFGAKTKR